MPDSNDKELAPREPKVYDETHSQIHVTALISSKLKHKRPPKKKPIYEEVSGRRKGGDGRVVDLTRAIDRENDRYIERVVDDHGTAEVDKDHPLSEHHKYHGKLIQQSDKNDG